MKRKKAYILYKYNNKKDDIEYIKEYTNINELIKELNIKNKRSIYNNIISSIDENYKHLLKKNYLIIKEEY